VGVKTGCFGCDVVIEADDAGAIADAFVAHAADVHEWDYPEQALRNYARNYADAVERLTGSTERLTEIGDVEIHPVTVDRIDDWLQLFDHDGFAGNPDWASCYCLFPHETPTPEEPERLWTDSRARMIERLESGITFGYLAYVDGKVAGWVNASSRADYADFLRIVDPDGPAPESSVGVSCFVIAPPYRRHGVAAALLDRVVGDAVARGASWVEGYPRNDPEEGDAGHFTGPRSMYDARGFEPVEVRERDTVMRRPAG
jgi:GNAT superfamily N-acetyltransferase